MFYLSWYFTLQHFSCLNNLVQTYDCYSVVYTFVIYFFPKLFKNQCPWKCYFERERTTGIQLIELNCSLNCICMALIHWMLVYQCVACILSMLDILTENILCCCVRTCVIYIFNPFTLSIYHAGSPDNLIRKHPLSEVYIISLIPLFFLKTHIK